MKKVLLSCALLALAASGSAAADEYRASIAGCTEAISKQMGLADADARYKLKDVKTRSRVRDLGFVVSVDSEVSPVKDVVVTCKVKRSGDVVALEFADGQYPSMLATQ
ncbi:MAG: hypothetical protein O3A63_17855 [Proteobacteria bacterium]|nr:hypothetical protein [Pseudomonadota bacterium]